MLIQLTLFINVVKYKMDLTFFVFLYQFYHYKPVMVFYTIFIQRNARIEQGNIHTVRLTRICVFQVPR